MTIHQLNELLMERDELKQRIRKTEQELPLPVRTAMMIPGALEYAQMIIQRNNLEYRITEAEKIIQSQINP